MPEMFIYVKLLPSYSTLLRLLGQTAQTYIHHGKHFSHYWPREWRVLWRTRYNV